MFLAEKKANKNAMGTARTVAIKAINKVSIIFTRARGNKLH